jgi:hypothetical protein
LFTYLSFAFPLTFRRPAHGLGDLVPMSDFGCSLP